MKIKTKPSDFIVEELLNQGPEQSGSHNLYLLEKENENTIELLLEISKKFHINFSDFGYGGRKDKHALTRQYITIQNCKKIPDIRGKKWSLTHAGYLNRPMGPDLIKENNFTIIVRDLKPDEIDTLQREIPKIKSNGFANYFDDQRFGTFDTTQGFFAEKIIKQHFNGALKIYLTHISSSDRKDEKELKKFYYENWGDWQKCLNRSKMPTTRSFFNHLVQKNKDFIPLLRKIPRHELSLYFSAYQGYLWNETLRRLISERTDKHLTHKGLVGDYLFFDIHAEENSPFWKNLYIPTIASKIDVADSELGDKIKEILDENGLKTSMFNITKIRQAYFKSTQRKAIVLPEGLSDEYGIDEFNQGAKQMLIKFSLPRGSYATILIKRLFSK